MERPLETLHVTAKLNRYCTCEYYYGEQLFFTILPYIFLEEYGIRSNDYFTAELDGNGNIVLETISKNR